MFSAHYSLKAKLMFMHQISNNLAENINRPIRRHTRQSVAIKAAQ